MTGSTNTSKSDAEVGPLFGVGLERFWTSRGGLVGMFAVSSPSGAENAYISLLSAFPYVRREPLLV